MYHVCLVVGLYETCIVPMYLYNRVLIQVHVLCPTYSASVIAVYITFRYDLLLFCQMEEDFLDYN